MSNTSVAIKFNFEDYLRFSVMGRNRVVFLFLMLFSFVVYGQDDIRFTASAKGMVEVGERFSIVYEVNGNASGFVSPDFRNLQVISGPSQSSSSSVQIINGSMQHAHLGQRES